MSGESVEVTGGATLTTGQISVAATATVILAAGSRLRVTITNTSAATVFIGATSGVTTSTGHAVPAGTTQTFLTRSALYGIVASSTSTVTYAAEAL